MKHIFQWLSRLQANFDAWMLADVEKYLGMLSPDDREKALTEIERMAKENQRKKREKLLALLNSKSDEELEQLVVDIERLEESRTRNQG